jgi:hypothetical protein
MMINCHSSPSIPPPCQISYSPVYQTTALFNFLALQFDSLSIDKDALPLVRLWNPPFPDLGCKLHDYLLLHAL